MYCILLLDRSKYLYFYVYSIVGIPCVGLIEASSSEIIIQNNSGWSAVGVGAGRGRDPESELLAPVIRGYVAEHVVYIKRGGGGCIIRKLPRIDSEGGSVYLTQIPPARSVGRRAT